MTGPYIPVFVSASNHHTTQVLTRPLANTLAWVANNVEGSYKRSVTMAFVNSFGNLMGAVTSNVYRAKDKPWFRLGHGIILMYIGIGFFSSIFFKFLLTRENLKRDRGERDEIIKPSINEKVCSCFFLQR
jgi:hypothetical protein